MENPIFTKDGKRRVMTFEELKSEVRLEGIVNTAPEARVWTAQFDLPNRGYASMHIQKGGSTEFIVECMTWEETKLIRKLVKFGSNHDQKPTTWTLLSGYLEFLAIAIPNEREEEFEVADNVWHLQHPDPKSLPEVPDNTGDPKYWRLDNGTL